MARPRKYKLNENYFDKIDSGIKAYILGFIYADGCICRNKLWVIIHKDDIETLNLIKAEIETEQPIVLNNNVVKLVISSKRLCEGLTSQGIIERKTYKSHSLPYKGKYIQDFLRGFFDGDGGISVYKNTSIVSFSNNVHVLTELKKHLIDKLGINSYLKQRANTDYSWTLFITGSIQINKLYNYLYCNKCISLRRKRDKFSLALKMSNNTMNKFFKYNGLKEKIEKLYYESKTSTQIAKILNINQSSVSHFISRNLKSKVKNAN